MRDRIVDFILLAALILIAAVIVWTLFGTSFRRDVRPVTTPPPSTNDVLVNPTDDTLAPPPVDTDTEAQENLGTVQPVDLEDALSDTQTDTLDALPEDGAEETTLESDAIEDDVATGDVTAVALGDEPETSVADEQPLDETLSEAVPEETEPARTLAAGSFDLERIGFSFVTGGPGSCGQVLEAWTHVAVSSDILADYPCGSEITVTIDETVGGRDSFTAIVGDTMNPSNTQTVNIYVAEDEPALEYGVRTGTLEP